MDNRKRFSGRRGPYSNVVDDPGVNKALINMRLAAGITQEEAAKKLNISKSMYKKLESNKRIIKKEMYERAQEVFRA